MDESRTFRTKITILWMNLIVLLGLLATALFLFARGYTNLGAVALVLLLAGVLWGRSEAYQRVTVEEAGIRYKRALDRERFLFWSGVSGARMRGDQLELLGEPRPIRIFLGTGFQDKDGFMKLLAEHLPHLIAIAPPLTVEGMEPPANLPLIGRPKLIYLLLLVFFLAPFGLFFLVMGGITAYGAFSGESVWVSLAALLMAIFVLALGAWLLLWLIHELPQRVILDEDGVHLRSWVRGGYLSWSQVEDATLGRFGRDIRLRGAAKSLSFVFGWFPKRQRDAFAQALQYYLILHQVPIHRRDWLLP
jgi:small-conductance mechanosensitive channel